VTDDSSLRRSYTPEESEVGGVKISKELDPGSSKCPLSRCLLISHSHMQLSLEERGQGLRFDIEGIGS
jgi:hypothetical protein